MFVAVFGLIISLISIGILPAMAIVSERSLVDRPDDFSGFQIHLVYVVPASSLDLNSDINGQIDAWVKEANAWLKGKVGKSLKFDTFKGDTDVSFMQSKYRTSELCIKKCETLSNLQDEYLSQNRNFESSKTLLFLIGDELDSATCGWSENPSNLALVHNFANSSDGCNWPTSKDVTGLSGPAGTITHELIHTFGVDHVCSDNSDLMIGIPECTIDKNTFGHVPITLDLKANQYAGSDSTFGIDILKMPIWSDGSGTKSYAEIKQISGEKYISKLDGVTVYAVVGKVSEKFDWDWEKDLRPEGGAIDCTLTTGASKIKGQIVNSACTFDIPNTLRAGSAFTVAQSWEKGPWHGNASVTGKLVRSDLSSTPCSESACFVGGSTFLHNGCWPSNVVNLVLQQVVNGKWKEVENLKATKDDACKKAKFPNSVNYELAFKQPGTFVYRWVSPKSSGWSATYDTPFAVVVNDSTQPEPTQSEIELAQSQALLIGKQADTRVSTSQKITITCVKGNLTKKVISMKPVCPSGYKKK